VSGCGRRRSLNIPEDRDLRKDVEPWLSCMSSGTHTVIVRAWDSTGAFGDRTLTITVQ